MAVATADFETKTAMVEMKPGTTLTEDAVKKAFEGSHYSLKSMSEVPH